MQIRLDFWLKCIFLCFFCTSTHEVLCNAGGADTLFAAAKKGDLAQVKRLLATENIDVNTQDATGKGAIHWASEYGQLHVVKYLVHKCNAQVNLQDKAGRTALHYASQHGHLSIVKFLLGGGYLMQVLRRWLHHIKVLCGKNIEHQQRVDVNAQGKEGFTALHCASAQGHFAVVKYLAGTCNANVNLQDTIGNTSLHWAAFLGRLHVIQYLVEECNANVDLVNKNNQTAYDLASLRKNSKEAAYLKAPPKRSSYSMIVIAL